MILLVEQHAFAAPWVTDLYVHAPCHNRWFDKGYRPVPSMHTGVVAVSQAAAVPLKMQSYRALHNLSV